MMILKISQDKKESDVKTYFNNMTWNLNVFQNMISGGSSRP